MRRPIQRLIQRDEAGATIVEASLAVMLLMLLVFSVFEFGLWFRDDITVSNATRSGARAASVAGADMSADWQVLHAIDKASAALPGGKIEKVVIYNASGPHDEPPADCLVGTAGIPGVCNVYLSSDVPIARADYDSVAFGKKNDWPGNTRDDTTVTGPGFVGVWTTATHKAVTGLIPYLDNKVVTSSVVMRIEPKRNTAS